MQEFYDGIITFMDKYSDAVRPNARNDKKGWEALLTVAEAKELADLEEEALASLDDSRLSGCSLGVSRAKNARNL